MDASPSSRIRSVWISALVGTVLILLGLLFLRLELTIRSTGLVLAKDEYRVFAPAEGVIARHHVELGHAVKRGDLLVELDDTDLALRAVQLQRELAETEAAHERNEIALREFAVKPAPLDLLTADDRKERLTRITAIQDQIERSYASARGLQVISELELRKQEIEKLRSEVDLLQATVQAEWLAAGVPAFDGERLRVEQKRLDALLALIRRDLELVELRRAARRIVAPLDGRVASIDFRFPGMAVAKGDELLKIAAPDGGYRVLARVPERNVDLVHVGTKVLMESEVFDSMLEGYVKGSVTRIAPESGAADAADASGAPASYEVDIAVEETPYPLVLGSRVRVILTLGRRPLTDMFFRSARSLRGPAARQETSS